MDLINAERAHRDGDMYGNGITVAVLDCGCRASHMTFSSADAVASRVLEGRNFTRVGDDTDTRDDKGHGTSVAAIIAGRSDSSPGVAPKARILPLKATIDPKDGDFSSVLEALTWLLTDGRTFNVSVVNLSLGDPGNYRSTNEALAAGGPARKQIVDKIGELRKLRIPTVAAVGNSFFSDKSKLGMCFPAIVPDCISVGAVFVDDSYFEWTFPDCGSALVHQSFAERITPFSQRLPRSGTDPHFTRLFAPGAPVESAGREDNSDFVEGLHGASVAAPFVTGVIALLQEKFKTLQSGQLPPCDDLERWLLKGARPIVDKNEGNDDVQHDGSTYKLLDASGALEAMMGHFLVG